MLRRRIRPIRRMFWVPLAYAAAGVACGIVLPRVEAAYPLELTLAITVSSAQIVLSTIASGMMALTAIVFSVAFVMVQFSATAYSPRLVLWLARSTVINHSIGVFTATFLYSIGAISWVDRAGSGTVPPITVWFAVGMLFVSVLFFVLLIEKVGMLQVTRVLKFAGDQGRKVIERMYPARQGQVRGTSDDGAVAGAPVIATIVHRGSPGIVQSVRTRDIVALAVRHDVLVELAVAVGDTVMDGLPLLRVRGTGTPPREAALLRAVELGPDRTFEQDPKYAVRLLVDVAIKALSPAINDPTTAVQALDQIEDLLLRLGRCDLDVGRMCDDQGRLRFVMPVPTWDDLVVLSLDEIRFCGATSVQVMRRIRAMLADLTEQVRPERRAALEYYQARVDAGIRRDFADADDQRDASENDRQGLGMSRASRALPSR